MHEPWTSSRQAFSEGRLEERRRSTRHAPHGRAARWPFPGAGVLTESLFHDGLARPPAGHTRVTDGSANTSPHPKRLRGRRLRGRGYRSAGESVSFADSPLTELDSAAQRRASSDRSCGGECDAAPSAVSLTTTNGAGGFDAAPSVTAAQHRRNTARACK